MYGPSRGRAVRDLLWPLLGLAAGAAFLYLALRSVSLAELGRILAAGNWGLPLVGILATVALFMLAKARRWRVLLGDPAEIPPVALLRPVAAGLLFNALIPHSGEFARAFAVNRDFARPTSGVLASIAVERVLDFLAVLCFAVLAGALTPVPPPLAPALIALTTVSLVLALIVAATVLAPALVLALLGRLTARLPTRLRTFLDRQIHHGLDGLAPLRAAHRVGRAFGLSLLQWGAIVGCILACAQVVGLTLGAPAAALIMVAMVLVFTLPNAPAYVGATQVAFLAVLVPLGIAKTPALAASLVYTVGMVGVTMLAGVLALMTQPGRPRLP
jgi:uncharacterized membrane protein YbhN (UPF0104 family)